MHIGSLLAGIAIGAGSLWLAVTTREIVKSNKDEPWALPVFTYYTYNSDQTIKKKSQVGAVEP